jgi:hypothetical protein
MHGATIKIKIKINKKKNSSHFLSYRKFRPKISSGLLGYDVSTENSACIFKTQAVQDE